MLKTIKRKAKEHVKNNLSFKQKAIVGKKYLINGKKVAARKATKYYLKNICRKIGF